MRLLLVFEEKFGTASERRLLLNLRILILRFYSKKKRLIKSNECVSAYVVAFYLHVHLPKKQIKSYCIINGLRVDGLEKIVEPRLFEIENEDDLARFF